MDPMQETLDGLKNEFWKNLNQALGAKNADELQRIRSNFFGPKGQITLILRNVGQLPPEQRREAGLAANRVRQELQDELSKAIETVDALARETELSAERLDLTLAGRHLLPEGKVHVVNRVIEEITDLFHRMGFEVATGPEVESEKYNFEALNFPDDHPARDMQDTFFVVSPDGKETKGRVLRTHTSPVQVRSLLERGVPLKIIAPGRVYRCDSDASHSPMFHQIEGLWVDTGVSFSHLKGVLTSFLNAMFGSRAVRFRPSFFPFVEPGAEVDMQCVFCEGSGCRVCKQTGWMEILGAGMVHPNVLEACKVDSERYTGFAFGLGIDRIAMLRWRIDDLGHLFRGDMRFLDQV